VVVIGAGQAGSSLVAKLRSLGFEGDITLIGEESDPPYQRPPLSKAYLLGEMDRERLYLRPEKFYEEQNIILKLGTPVAGLNTAAKTVSVGGETISYDQLAFTTGSTPRRLPERIGGTLEGVHVVRTLADVDAMAPTCRAGKTALVVGGGYIGLEAAAVLRKLGLSVTLIEMADRILGRVAAPETADYFRALHKGHGVDLREGIGLDHLTGGTHVTGAVLTDGSVVPADLVIVGVGIEPNARIAQDVELEINNGIVVDEMGRTSDPNIWAAGDCAIFPFRGEKIRLESVQNAIDQAEAVAANMLGANKAYEPKPWFWSDQYDVKLQIAGLNTGYDRVVVREVETSRSHWYYLGDTLLAVDAMNDPRSYMIGKRLIEAGKSPDRAIIEDPSADLKPLLKA
ncbi:MAG: FAD-dependent oxidoreductase, partial [Dinoroseobacter sp.]|nr:FAD-dependent oxidoreductase [Dinoroseobacter sp.]